ncbi:MAG: phage terminase small subunit P27 family [Sneathiella sp.]
MGKRGPKPKPQKLRDIDGNPEKRAALPDPVAASGRPMPPAWLSEYALAVWDDILKSMPPTFYATADTQILAAYCIACAVFKEAAQEVIDGGPTLVLDKKLIKNPAATVMGDQQGKIASLGTRLGLDPAARQAIMGSSGAAEKPPSKYAGLIGIDGGKKQ